MHYLIIFKDVKKPKIGALPPESPPGIPVSKLQLRSLRNCFLLIKLNLVPQNGLQWKVQNFDNPGASSGIYWVYYKPPVLSYSEFGTYVRTLISTQSFMKAYVSYLLSNFHFFTKWYSFKNYEKCFISSKKIFSFSRYSNFCISVFPSFSPFQPLV